MPKFRAVRDDVKFAHMSDSLGCAFIFTAVVQIPLTTVSSKPSLLNKWAGHACDRICSLNDRVRASAASNSASVNSESVLTCRRGSVNTGLSDRGIDMMSERQLEDEAN
jgi:hypothetical protein